MIPPSGVFGIWLATFAFSAAGGIVPLLSVEAYVLVVSTASPQADMLPVALAAALGQMLASTTARALSSVPPFYAVSLAAGALRLRYGGFLAAGGLGTFVRFAALFALPRLLAG